MDDEQGYQVTHAWEGDILVITITGRATPRNADEIAQKVSGIMAEARPKYVLTDCRKVRGRLTAGEAYQHIRRYPRPTFTILKRAIVDLEENRSYWAFHETAAANAGLDLRFFTDRDEALAWLRADANDSAPR